MICNEILFSDHAIIQMFKRNIAVEDIRSVIEGGEIIADYFNDKPFPSYLVLGFVNGRPLHIVVGKDDKDQKCIVVTAYEPDENIWRAGFKLKK